MNGLDDWDVVGLVFVILLLAFFALYALLRWLETNEPSDVNRRNIAGRRRMATDYKKPAYLPDDWH